MPLTKKGKKIMKSMEKTYGKKKAKEVFYASKNKGKLFGVDKSGKAKPIKALTGLEIALISGAVGLAGQQMMAPKMKTATYNDPFKNLPAKDPSEFVQKATSASNITSEALNPVTSQSESISKQVAEDAVDTEDTEKMSRGGKVRGVKIAQRGYKNIRVV